MDFDLDMIKSVRKKIDLTQSELAKKSGVSQSLIAKIEAGRIDPTYSKVRQIYETLQMLSEEKDLTAEDIMLKKIISIDLNDNLEKAVQKMRKYEISQLPVFDDKKVVGLISEAAILNSLMDESGDRRIERIMQDPPPIINNNASVRVISGLLKFYPAVLVSCRGRICGIITKSDIIRKIYH
ncbi:MAG: CBS domain-containing protein [archaeon]